MSSSKTIEHFVTLFDSKFLPMGISLHDSLMTQGQPFHLWIVCMDDLVEEQLVRISLPNVTLITLMSVETQDLLEVKTGRTRGEYCWTITPFTFQAVFDRDKSVERVTYLDADLFFFSSPQILLRELNESGKHVLITEHAYAPEYDRWLDLSGRFCVQFLTFRNTHEARKVMRWWQERCVEWCFARPEDGKFGDQKYLDRWPDLFPGEIHIVRQTEKTLAPWNVHHFERTRGGSLDPVFYHFHGLRVVAPRKVRLCDNYRIGRSGLFLYRVYMNALSRSVGMLQALGLHVPYTKERFSMVGTVRSLLYRTPRFMNIKPVLPLRNNRNS
jgi:hypothetical protein